MLNQKNKFDIIIFGATGFTGKLVVEYFLKNYGFNNPKLNWAIAGRSEAKLEKLKKSFIHIDQGFAKINIFVADSFDSKSLDVLTSSCRVIISTVGPYLKYGLPLIKSCVKNNTSYCDITGEVPFIRESIDLFHEEAKKNKCRIVHSCGFDSIPSDLGVLLLQRTSLKKYDKLCNKVNLYVQEIKGSLSGGTIASVVNLMKYKELYPDKRHMFKSPFSLNPTEEINNHVDQPIPNSIRWDGRIKKWTAPFLMSGINTRIVRRTNAIANFSYGKNFKYNEMSSYDQGLSGFLKASMILCILGLLQLSIKSKTLLWILKNVALPKPGEGPSKNKMNNGFFKMRLIGYTKNNAGISVTVAGYSDPGYSATAKMLAEAAISILLNEDKIPKSYGVLTPASGIGLTLIDRLKEKNISFKVDSEH
tara:strand:- start:1823 stop:3079 length:1257 start_codon:yes stop_codon:yes gene_type:complete